jgi:hypothetical protein
MGWNETVLTYKESGDDSAHTKFTSLFSIFRTRDAQIWSMFLFHGVAVPIVGLDGPQFQLLLHNLTKPNRSTAENQATAKIYA